MSMLWYALTNPVRTFWIIRTQARYIILGNSNMDDCPDWFVRLITDKPKEVEVTGDAQRYFQLFVLEARRRGLK